MYLIFVGLVLVIVTLLFLVKRYRVLYIKERHKKASMSVKHGKFLEHYIPWVKEIFPYKPEKFRFIGNPIDGILFDDDKIVFMEFKTGNSSLSKVQRKIRSMVKSKKVEWKEISTN